MSVLEALALMLITLGVVAFCVLVFVGGVSVVLGIGLRETLLGNAGDE